MKSRRLRALAAACAAALLIPALTPAPAAAAGPVLEITSIAFDRVEVDVTEDYATANLTWTITNRSARADQINGAVELRQFNGEEQVGLPHTVSYSFNGGWTPVRGTGTAQESTYSYDFPVPRYSSAARTVWRVTKVTIADDAAHARTVRDPGPAAVTTTQLVDADGPTVEQVYFGFDQPRAFYDDGSGVTLNYQVTIRDQSAFRRGKLTLAGPGGTRLSSTFQLVQSGTQWLCNGETVWDPTWLTCSVPVVVPPGSTSGAWRIARVELTDAFGNTKADSVPEQPEPIQVTRNDVISATDFALTRTEVNNWRRRASTDLTFEPHGLVGGLASVEVAVNWCSQPSLVPPVGDDGTVAVEIVMPAEHTSSCEFDGVKLTDGAGNVALYGTEYGAPGLYLVVRQVPDDKAPVALSARLPKATWTQQ